MLNFRSRSGATTPNLVIGEGTKIMPDAKLVPQQVRINWKELHYPVRLPALRRRGIKIGDDSRIAAYTVMTPMNHVFADPETPVRLQGETAKGIRIGRDVWIGTGVKILDGVEIGDGCVVGAGSVVTKSLPPFAVAVGVPAKVRHWRDARRAAAWTPNQSGSVEER